MATPDPVTDPAAWSSCWLAGERLLGTVKVTGSSAADLDVQKTKGRDGAVIQDNGYTPAKLSLSCEFVPSMFAEIQALCDKLQPRKPGGKRQPVSIKHARTDFLGIHSVYIEEISAPDVDDRGMMSLTMSLLEWVPEPKPVKTSSSKKARAVKEGGSRDPWAPGSFISPPLTTQPRWKDMHSHQGSEADEEFQKFLDGAV